MNIDLGGLARGEAERLLNAEVDKLKSQQVIHVNHDERAWPLTDKDLGWQVQVESLIEEAYAVGREGSILDKLKERFYAYNNGKTITFDVAYDQDKLRAIIDKITLALERQPRNASLAMVNGAPSLVPEITGIKIDKQQAFQTVDSAIREKKDRVDLPATVNLPPITQNDLKDVTDVLSSYATYFNPWAQDRSHNVALAASHLNGVLLKPGDIFSFNKGIGPRTVEMGYRDAPVYIGEDIVPGIGGGICQVSSTLYNAVMLADLKITERENHYRPVPYVALGCDATIAGDFIDLKFQNNLSSNIYIRSFIEDDQMIVQILGKKTPEHPEVKIITDNVRVIKYKTITKTSDKLLPGEKKVERPGANGYQVTTYRFKYQQGKLIAREKLHDDYYPAVNEIMEVGAEELALLKTKDEYSPFL